MHTVEKLYAAERYVRPRYPLRPNGLPSTSAIRHGFTD